LLAVTEDELEAVQGQALHVLSDLIVPRPRGVWLSYVVPLLVYGFLGILGYDTHGCSPMGVDFTGD
jgi:hypothetical protein